MQKGHIRKNILFTFLVFISIDVWTQNGIFFKVDYNTPIFRDSLGQEIIRDDIGFIESTSAIKATNRKGFSINLGYEQEVYKGIGLSLSGLYLKSSQQVYHSDFGDGKEYAYDLKRNMWSKSLIIIPKIFYQYKLDTNIYVQAHIGLQLPVVNLGYKEMLEKGELQDLEIDILKQEKYKYYFSAGFTCGLNIKYMIAPKIAASFGIDLSLLKMNVKYSEVEQMFFNRVNVKERDVLSNLETNYTKGDLSEDSNNPFYNKNFDVDKPLDEKSYKENFNSFSFGIGLHFAF